MAIAPLFVAMGMSATAAATAATVTTVAVTALGAATAYSASKSADKQQKEYNKAVTRDAVRQYGELDTVEAEAIKESHAGSLKAQRERLQARSNIELQSAFSGTAGNSVDIALADINTGYGARLSEITAKRDFQLTQTRRQAENIAAGASMKMDNSVRPPAWYSALSSGLSAYSSMSAMEGKVSTKTKDAAPARNG